MEITGLNLFSKLVTVSTVYTIYYQLGMDEGMKVWTVNGNGTVSGNFWW